MIRKNTAVIAAAYYNGNIEETGKGSCLILTDNENKRSINPGAQCRTNFDGLFDDLVFLQGYNFERGSVILADAGVAEVAGKEYGRMNISGNDILYVMQPYMISVPHKMPL